MLAPIAMLALVGQYVGATDLGVTASVNVIIPSEPPVITSPKDGAIINGGKVVVSGGCPTSNAPIIVAVYEKLSLLGSDQCSVAGTFSVTVSLANGHHTLKATVVTATNQVGQTSQAVGVVSHPQSATPSAGGASITPVTSAATLPLPIIVHAKDIFLVIGSGGYVTWHGSFSGGTSPYAVSIDWGDGKAEKLTVSNHLVQTFTHHYDSLRAYSIGFHVTDSRNGSTAFYSSAVTLALQQVAAIDNNLALPPITLTTVEQYAINAYIMTLSGLTFLWYLQHGHVLVTSMVRSKKGVHIRRRR